MPKKSNYDLSDYQMLKVPQEIWKKYVEKHGKAAAERARDDLDLCIGVEDKNDGEGQLENNELGSK